MQRRDVLKAFGAATALALLPHEAVAAWARVATGVPPAEGLTDGQLALVGAIADTILPRTDTPGAIDVGVPAFINVIVAENYSDTDRSAFLAGLDAIEAQAKTAGAPFVDLAPSARAATIESIESPTDRRAEPARTYWRLKGLIVHGYFTSERVMNEVFKVDIMPGKFEGAAPHVIKAPQSGAGQSHA